MEKKNLAIGLMVASALTLTACGPSSQADVKRGCDDIKSLLAEANTNLAKDPTGIVDRAIKLQPTLPHELESVGHDLTYALRISRQATIKGVDPSQKQQSEFSTRIKTASTTYQEVCNG